jgi:hypothetical protein
MPFALNGILYSITVWVCGLCSFSYVAILQLLCDRRDIFHKGHYVLIAILWDTEYANFILENVSEQ